MTPAELKIRFDELCAGRAIDDLSAQEERELASLCAQLGIAPDADFELLAAALEVNLIGQTQEAMPAHLANKLHQWADQTAQPLVSNVIHPQIPAWKTIARNPATGWAAAAALLMATLFISRDERSTSPSQTDVSLRAQATDLIERKFEGLGEFANAGGTVIWSDDLQQGFMTLSGIPANDPKQAQYQLWIVDPARDADSPVDGGVFDIPANGKPVIIPIDAKLALASPTAFVITLEQPGGVVKSKQEVVVALAKS